MSVEGDFEKEEEFGNPENHGSVRYGDLDMRSDNEFAIMGPRALNWQFYTNLSEEITEDYQIHVNNMRKSIFLSMQLD